MVHATGLRRCDGRVRGSCLITVNMPLHSRAILVEDSPERVKWFRDKLGSRLLGVEKQPEHAIRLLRTLDPNSLDVIFLDHDLGGDFNVPPYTVDVAKYLTTTLSKTWPGFIVIHSHNPGGAQNLAAILHEYDVHVWPFGTFNLVGTE